LAQQLTQLLLLLLLLPIVLTGAFWERATLWGHALAIRNIQASNEAV
jgi:hypothetical protein